MLMIEAPWSAAQTIPLAIVDEEPMPLSFITLTGRIWHDQQRPATPMPLLPRAAMMPATAVPWLLTSSGVGSLYAQSRTGSFAGSEPAAPAGETTDNAAAAETARRTRSRLERRGRTFEVIVGGRRAALDAESRERGCPASPAA